MYYFSSTSLTHSCVLLFFSSLKTQQEICSAKVIYEWKEETNTYKRGTRLIEKGGEKNTDTATA
jgi:hypothetical protein